MYTLARLTTLILVGTNLQDLRWTLDDNRNGARMLCSFEKKGIIMDWLVMD